MKVPTIFDIILMEATKKTKDGLLVDLDADDVENDTDYTQDVDVEDDEIDLGDQGGDGGDATDNALDNALSDNPIDPNNKNKDEQVSNNPEDTTDGQNLPENGDGEDAGTDYTAMDDDPNSIDGENPDMLGDEQNAGVDNKRNSFALLNDFLTLYDIISNGIESLQDVHLYDNNKIIVLKKVSANLIKMKTYLYRYVIHDFDKNSYIENLTVYNYFTSALSVNIKMFKKAQEFSSIEY